MKSLLLPSTVAMLKTVKGPTRELHTNAVQAEAFDAKHTHGRFKVYPRTDGKFCVVDPLLPVGGRTVAVKDKVEQADHVALALSRA